MIKAESEPEVMFFISYISTVSEALQLDKYGETAEASLETTPQVTATKTAAAARKRHHHNRTNGPEFGHHQNNNNNSTTNNNINNNNNNNNVKNERLSPSNNTDISSSRSRSVTPSSHPDTPPSTALESHHPLGGRNYSDFMRSLAAKYNNTNPNDAARNGLPPPLDPRFKPFPLLPTLKDASPDSPQSLSSTNNHKKSSDFSALLNPFAGPFPPLIDMSTTQTLLAMVRTAKEAELHNLLKSVKRQDSSSPLDLSASSAPVPPGGAKRPKLGSTKSSSPPDGSSGVVITTTSSSPLNINNSPGNNNSNGSSSAGSKRAQSESPSLNHHLHNSLHQQQQQQQHQSREEVIVSSWGVDDVCSFVGSIDICAEYAQNFRDQRIDGAGLPLLTEEHLTSTMGMKLGPALKLRSILAKKLGSCSVCLHCTHCHRGAVSSPEPTNNSDLGGGTS